MSLTSKASLAQHRTWIRSQTPWGARDRSPIVIVEGDQGPTTEGEAGYWTTPSGKTRITYPNAYKWRKVYHCSTARIVVGREWLADRISADVIACLAGDDEQMAAAA